MNQAPALDISAERPVANNSSVSPSRVLHGAWDRGIGHAYVIEPGHDAWVVGDEPVVRFEFESRTAEEYAKGS